MVSCHMLSELEEVIQYKLVPERREIIRQIWWERLQVSLGDSPVLPALPGAVCLAPTFELPLVTFIPPLHTRHLSFRCERITNCPVTASLL